MMTKTIIFLLIACTLCAPQTHAQELGLINVSVCNTRAEAEYTSGQESQALLGMPVDILDRHNEWTQVRTPDGYEAWVLSGCVHTVSREELTLWNSRRQAVVTSLTATVRERPSHRAMAVSDVVAGNRLQLLGRRRGFLHVRFPDGREGFLPRSMARPVDEWRRKMDRSPQAIIVTAQRLMGLPYMWGGTSAKGVDCSGLVSAVMYMHDIIVPRNADQQALEGERIPTDDSLARLQPGDLLFFGEKAHGSGEAYVVHVGIYMGQGRFIHSLGRVCTASLDPSDAQYDAYNHGRLLFGGRILPYVNRSPHLVTTDQSPLYR